MVGGGYQRVIMLSTSGRKSIRFQAEGTPVAAP